LESQPLITPYGQLLIWDGRLDNREELIDQLTDELPDRSTFPLQTDVGTLTASERRQLSRTVCSTPAGTTKTIVGSAETAVSQGDTLSRVATHTDVAIVAAAYRKWGEEFLPKIIGDFALALWDARLRRLLLARDAVGTRTLYYHANANRIIWSSVFEPILDLGDITVEVDEEYIAAYLAVQTTPMDRTPYAGIHAVEPGCVVMVCDGGIEKRRYWKIDPSNEIKYSTDAEYEEHFRHLFIQAVRRRLRSDRPVWAELSGGLDSTSIVCVADHLVETGQVSIPKVKTTSHFTEGTLKSDEGKYIRWVEEQRGMVGFHLRYDDYCMKFADPQGRFYTHLTTGILHSRMSDALREEMHAQGIRILLSGHGGDQVLWATNRAAPELADLLYDHSFHRLHRRTKVWSEAFRKPYLSVLLSDALVPLLPESWQERHQRRLLKPPSWLEPAFARRAAELVLSVPTDAFGFRRPGPRLRGRYALKAIQLAGAGGYRFARSGDVAYPFLDRSLIEFLLAVPINQLMKDGVRRSLQRRALAGLVYPKILRRKYKGAIDDGAIRGLNTEWTRIEPLFAHLRLAELGYVDRDRLYEALLLARHGCRADTLQLMFTLSLELWLRSVEYDHQRPAPTCSLGEDLQASKLIKRSSNSKAGNSRQSAERSHRMPPGGTTGG
jgi:asparagine synthase (glutamine-hydrolysing)